MKHAYLPVLLGGLLAAPALAQTIPPAGAPPTARPTLPAGAPAPTAPKPLALSTVPRGTGRLTGTVLDAATKKPVEFATVALLPATGTTPLDGTVCDEKGRFVLKGLAPGTYRVQLSFVGYTGRTETVTVGEGSTDLGTVALTSAVQKLGEVTVTGERDVVETKPDRIVYNAEKDLTNAGGTAADVLRKVPLLSVDPEGNVQLRGTSNVLVLINNKPSGIVAGSVADAMKQIPADQIKTVEVITSPSAKYDAEGSGGIINITLKKNNLQGTNGSLGLAGGTRSSNANAALNYRQGKVGLTSSASGFAYYSPNRNDLERYLKNADGTERLTLLQRGEGNSLGGGGFGRLGLDYDPAQYHSLTLAVQGSMFRNSGDNQLFNESTPTPAFSNRFTRDSERSFHTQSYDVSGSYTRTFAQKRREWNVLGQHTRNRNNQDFSLDQYPGEGVAANPNYREQSLNLSRNLETTLQTDYVHPLSETTTLETGAKAIMRRVSSDYTVQTDPTGQSSLQTNKPRSNNFSYDQDVLAAYGSYGFSLNKKVSGKAGARVEQTRIDGSFKQGSDQGVQQDYTTLLPNLSLSYQPGNPKMPGQSLRAAYSQRIQRPQIFYLNPFVNATDSLNITYGNPQLEPERTHNVELSYTTFIKGSVLTISTYARRTGSAIEPFRFVDTVRVAGRPDRLVQNQTFRNIGRNATYGMSVFGSVKPVPKWDVSGTLNVYYVSLKSPSLGLSNSGMIASLNINSGYKFDKGLSLQFNGGLNSPRVQLQGRQAAWTFYSVGLRKSLLKDKADLTLNADNFLQATRNLSATLDTDQFRQESNNYIYMRGVRLAFNYRFGKVSAQPQKRRRGIQNDDVKQGESNQGQQ
ncbi:Outer membrane receptor proteins, mostly Fe transport [Hymenobacter daecheongensis DSM 21074]|uniref:Outer membrane receptor proteins, mostly Fe transport n=1 Tax=Hymenobacter daecheongensis DSM 21074 TaxID=1121955 RepID=A0A1M6DH03_9BACT|nr:TonB-dependent receptor [Hymenobacter daecheongensis]SHI72627.1 Outer membrane receptor proteins, mostly Fe transport [Hymenobacter daecheongensis DSM 21074]